MTRAASTKTASCTCTHPTHFLGRCNKPVGPPEHKCADCKREHLYPAADPIEGRSS